MKKIFTLIVALLAVFNTVKAEEPRGITVAKKITGKKKITAKRSTRKM